MTEPVTTDIQPDAALDIAPPAVTALVDKYFAMWNTPDVAGRHTLVEAVWSADAHYVDPLISAVGQGAIEAMVTEVGQRLAGTRFRRASEVGTHNGFFRYQWEMLAADGSRLRTGASFGQIDSAGRLRQLVGFFD